MHTDMCACLRWVCAIMVGKLLPRLCCLSTGVCMDISHGRVPYPMMSDRCGFSSEKKVMAHYGVEQPPAIVLFRNFDLNGVRHGAARHGTGPRGTCAATLFRPCERSAVPCSVVRCGAVAWHDTAQHGMARLCTAPGGEVFLSATST